MNIIIAGAGEVGRYLAEVLTTSGQSVTIIDLDAAKLRPLEDALDISTLQANSAHADSLRQAGAEKCDMFIAATSHDEINLLSASVAKGLGAKKSVARVHHSAYFDGRGLDYLKYFRIDSMICPEYATATAIARTVRNPGAIAVEDFAGGQIEMRQIVVTDSAPAVGVPLAELNLPHGVRIAVVTRDDRSFIPDASTTFSTGDLVTLIGEKGEIEDARRLLKKEKTNKKNVVIMGGTPMGVWLCRTLRSRYFNVRLFVTDHARAEELAAKLEKITVIEAMPTEPQIFAEEHIGDCDAFVALTDDDEQNILAAAQAKSGGVKLAVTVTKRSTYLHLLEHVGIDRAFSPRIVAAREIQLLLETGPVRVLASLVDVTADVYEINLRDGAPVAGKPLRTIQWPAPCVIGGLQRGDRVFLPGADDSLESGDVVLVIGGRGLQKKLTKLFVG